MGSHTSEPAFLQRGEWGDRHRSPEPPLIQSPPSSTAPALAQETKKGQLWALQEPGLATTSDWTVSGRRLTHPRLAGLGAGGRPAGIKAPGSGQILRKLLGHQGAVPAYSSASPACHGDLLGRAWGTGAVAWPPGREGLSSSPHKLGTPGHRGFRARGGLLDLWAAQGGAPGAPRPTSPLPRRLGWSALAAPAQPYLPVSQSSQGRLDTHLPLRRQGSRDEWGRALTPQKPLKPRGASISQDGKRVMSCSCFHKARL